MTDNWTAALEATTLAVFLRGSVWAYPLVNAGHLLGIALLVGAVIPLDLRLIGFWPSVQPAQLWRVLTRVAVFGFGLAAVFGSLLFICRATAYVGSFLFVAKMALVAIAALNALALHRVVSAEGGLQGAEAARLPLRLRLAALTSLILWPTILILGRLVGYF
jgi:hypothetical protein